MVHENVAIMALVQATEPDADRARRGAAARRAPAGRTRCSDSCWGPRASRWSLLSRGLVGPARWGAIGSASVGALGIARAASTSGGSAATCRVQATAVQVAAGAALTVAAMLAFERPHAVWTAAAVTAVAWNVLAMWTRAMALYYYMLNRGTAGRVAANLYLIPGTVAIFGATLLGEQLTALAVLGLAVASLGVFLVARPQPDK